MKSYNTVTGNVEPNSEAGVSLASLMETAGGFQKIEKRLENGEFVNAGEIELSIAILQNGHQGAPSTAQYKRLPAGETLVFERCNLDFTFIRTADDAGNNLLEFIGTPVIEERMKDEG